MKEQMNHRERVLAALSGKDVDRPPVSMWRHFFAEETTADGLAEAMLAFQDRFDWDFMKVNPRASYHAEDWGLRMHYDGDRQPCVVGTSLKGPEDWLGLKVLDVNRGVLGDHLRALETIARRLPGDVPFIMTVFTPLSIAARLAPSEEVFLEHMRGHTDRVRYALDVVTETFIRFSIACLERGASGLFYATTEWATSRRMPCEEYRDLAMPYDLELLGSLPPCEFTVLHVCKDDNMLDLLKDYPVHAFNWDVRCAGNSSLAEGKALVAPRAVIGGLPHQAELVGSSQQQLASEVRGIRVAMGNRGWMLGTGCTFPPETPEANVQAIRQAAE